MEFLKCMWEKDAIQDIKKYKTEFEELRTSINIKRCEKIGVILLLLNIILIITDRVVYEPMRAFTPEYINLYYSHLIVLHLIIVWYVILFLNSIYKKFINEKILYNFFANIIIYWCLFMALNDLYINGQISAYIICVLSVASCLYSSPIEGVILYFVSTSLFISGLFIIIENNPNLLYGNIVNSVIVTFFAFIVSKVNYIRFSKDFISQKDLLKSKRDIEEKNEILIHYEKLRSDFFANISHELRTPINVIHSAEQVMELNLRKSQNYDMSKYLKMVKQNSFRLIRIISNLIDITKIDALSFDVKFRNLNIVKVVEDITISVAEFIEHKGLTVIFDTSIEEKVIACDPDLIERIMLNLLSNSVKFTKRGGSILVSIYLEEDKVCISVKDSGIGIPDNMKEIIFDRFIQVDKSTTKSCEGSGIGLSLVKSLVEIHKGTISLNSVISKGSEFIISLPDELCFEEDIHENIINLDDSRIEKINIEFSDIYN